VRDGILAGRWLPTPIHERGWAIRPARAAKQLKAARREFTGRRLQLTSALLSSPRSAPAPVHLHVPARAPGGAPCAACKPCCACIMAGAEVRLTFDGIAAEDHVPADYLFAAEVTKAAVVTAHYSRQGLEVRAPPSRLGVPRAACRARARSRGAAPHDRCPRAWCCTCVLRRGRRIARCAWSPQPPPETSSGIWTAMAQPRC
jgi:hypothetical protein